jgi:hypothetical protein
MYTDGSVFEDKVGVAVHIPSLDISIVYRSSNKLSVFSAELEAVFTAISLVVKHNIANPLILSDSLNIILLINFKMFHQPLQETLCMCVERPDYPKQY